MYDINPVLLDRESNNVQTIYNNNDPNPLVYIQRASTPITYQRFWEKEKIDSTVGTASAIAIRRTLGKFLGDMVFAAQIEDGDAVIRYAEPTLNIKDMVWTELTSIPNAKSISMVFSNIMEISDNIVESYTIGNSPYVAYTNFDDELKFINLDDENLELLISNDVIKVSIVAGLYAESIGLNDGIFCFFINADGELWEAQILNDELESLAQITLLPDGVTSWVDVWAGRTFDYRIVLQLKGDNDKVYTLVSKSRSSGYSIIEYINVSIQMSGKFGFDPPNLIRYTNIDDGYGNWGKYIELMYDNKVYNISSIEITQFKLVNFYNEEIYPVNIFQGETDNKIILEFDDFNNFADPAMLICLGCINMGSLDLSFDAFSFSVGLRNLWPIPSDFEYLDMAISMTGEYILVFDGKAYTNEYIEATQISMVGDLILLSFGKAYAPNEYIEATQISMVGQYCDINDIPL